MRLLFFNGFIILTLALARPVQAENSFNWDTNRNIVSADLTSRDLSKLLEEIAAATAWQVYLEPGTIHPTSAKFKNLPPGDALHLLFGDLNFALVPQTNSSPRLFVFRTAREHATLRIRPANETKTRRLSGKISNELIVRLKPGASIDDLARALGARVIGRIDSLNAYRLQFLDDSATESARDQLAGNADVAGVEFNYGIDPPPSSVRLDSASMPPIRLSLNPPAGSDHPIVGLIDTAVQPLGNDLDKFLVKSISVAGDANPDPGSPTHGTSMFEGILRGAATVAGGSSSMQVLSVDVYGPNPTTSTFDAAAGIVQAVNNGANIINLSLGSPGDSQLMKDLVAQVSQKGIPIYAAAGNNASPELFYPAAYPGVTSVTAASGPGQLAGYANYGSFINLIAPGSTVVYFGSSAFLVSGTSPATAYISGVTAGIAGSKNVTPLSASGTVGNMPIFQFHPAK